MLKDASTYVEEVVRDLDTRGGGFATGEAANLIVERVIEDYGLRSNIGPVIGAPLNLLRDGAAYRARFYDPREQTKKHGRPNALKDAVRSALGHQSDLVEIADDFAWIERYTGLDETQTSQRKQFRHLTYEETVKVIALKHKKARESAEAANQLQAVVDRNPAWVRQPDLTLGEILGFGS